MQENSAHPFSGTYNSERGYLQ
uniref:Uncharacterized protein n=1 Tax=Anguilla anguilla TaxID=7936 RepID=A0A0E9R1S8_ANGAN